MPALRYLKTLLSSSVLALCAGNVLAQPALEEIVVTAQRRAENLQQSPVSISAFSYDALAARQVNNLRDLGSQVPGLWIQAVNALQTAPRVYIRGQGSGSAIFNIDGAVGIYVDDVYIPRIFGAAFDFFDIERLEVLRGPQGTLYGRNTSGGAIKIVTKRPSDELTGGVDFAYGSFDQQDIKGYLSGPLVKDKLDASISVLSRDREGISTAPNLNGKKVNNRDARSGRIKLLYTPSDDLDVEFDLDQNIDKSGPFYGSAIVAANPALLPNASLTRDIFVTDANTPDQSKVTSTGGTAKAVYRTGDFTLTSLSGYRALENNTIIPLDTTPNSNSFTQLFLKQHNFSQEFNAAYNTETLSGVAGFYYFTEYNNYNAPIGLNPAEISRQKTNAYAGYTQATWHPESLPELGVTAGIRYSKETKSLYLFYPVPTPAVPVRVPKTGKESWDGTTPKISLEYQVTPDFLAYGSYTKGFKSGGWNRVPPQVQNGTLVYDVFSYNPENIDAYEAGAKFEGLDGRLRLNVAGYINTVKGLQVPLPVFPGLTIGITTNASSARFKGVELEPSWQINDLIQIYGNAAWTHAKYISPFTCVVSGVFSDCTNRSPPFVVPFKGLAGITLTPNVGLPGVLRFGASVDYSDGWFNDTANRDILRAQQRTLIDAIASYESEGQHWMFSLEGKNITDRTYYATTLAVGATVVVYPNDPRTVTARVKYKF